MISMIRTKISDFTTVPSGIGIFLFLVGVIIAIVFFFLGLPAAADLLMTGKLEWTPAVWTLMGLSFFAGFLYHSSTAEATQWQTKSIITPAELEIASMMWNSVAVPKPHEDKSKPLWVGVGIFVLVLLIRCGFEFNWYYISQALPQALMAWGTYALLIQAPWSAHLQLVAEKRATQRNEFSQYVIEARRASTDTWESLYVSKDLDDCTEALKKYAAKKKAGEFNDIRVVEEEGIRQVRMTFG